MKVKPRKSRTISIHRTNLSDGKFVIVDEEIPTIREKSVKILVGGTMYNRMMMKRW